MNEMFTRIVSTPGVFYKHQKMGEERLVDVEKEQILRELFDSNPLVFLTRYGKYMIADDCVNFSKSDDEIVQSILRQIQNRKEISLKDKKNRRFTAMQKLLAGKDYFSDYKMREREPYLYDAMVGRFLDDSEKQEMRPTVERPKNESTWAGMLDKFEDSCEISERRKIQEKEWQQSCSILRPQDHGHDHNSRFTAHVINRMEEDEFVPEEEEEEVEEDEIEKLRKEMERLARTEAEQYDELGDDDTPLLLRHEFESFMQQRFLAGKDVEFYDYSKCDNMAADDYSYVDPIRERDDEERWFDED